MPAVLQKIATAAFVLSIAAACAAKPEDAQPAAGTPESERRTPPLSNGRTISGGLGAAALGGILGAPETLDGAVADGAVVEGRLLGGPYRAYLDRSDIVRARRAALLAFETLPSGQTKIWRNPTNGHWGSMTLVRTSLDADNRYCREYHQTVTIGGQEFQANGTACRRESGNWRVVT